MFMLRQDKSVMLLRRAFFFVFINILLQLLLFVQCNYGDNELIVINKCEIPNQNTTNVCILKDLCTTYLESLKTRPLSSAQVNFLKKVQCNTQSNDIHVCCPSNNSSYVYVSAISEVSGISQVYFN